MATLEVQEGQSLSELKQKYLNENQEEYDKYIMELVEKHIVSIKSSKELVLRGYSTVESCGYRCKFCDRTYAMEFVKKYPKLHDVYLQYVHKLGELGICKCYIELRW